MDFGLCLHDKVIGEDHIAHNGVQVYQYEG